MHVTHATSMSVSGLVRQSSSAVSSASSARRKSAASYSVTLSRW
jgi:hypothetical protein